MTTNWSDGDQPRLLVAIVAYQGVLADETDAFREVLQLLPGARVVIAGAERGIVAGPGGAQEVEATFDELDRADVVVVPGGLGAHRHPEIAVWLRRIKPRFVLASSTGSALLAASGLLKGRTAVTHWLAGPLLELHGVKVSKARLEVDEPYVTCSGTGERLRRRIRRRQGHRRPFARARDPPGAAHVGGTATSRPSPLPPNEERAVGPRHRRRTVEVELEQHKPRRRRSTAHDRRRDR